MKFLPRVQSSFRAGVLVPSVSSWDHVLLDSSSVPPIRTFPPEWSSGGSGGSTGWRGCPDALCHHHGVRAQLPHLENATGTFLFPNLWFVLHSLKGSQGHSTVTSLWGSGKEGRWGEQQGERWKGCWQLGMWGPWRKGAVPACCSQLFQVGMWATVAGFQYLKTSRKSNFGVNSNC